LNCFYHLRKADCSSGLTHGHMLLGDSQMSTSEPRLFLETPAVEVCTSTKYFSKWPWKSHTVAFLYRNLFDFGSTPFFLATFQTAGAVICLCLSNHR
jgi:hypothetical protein